MNDFSRRFFELLGVVSLILVITLEDQSDIGLKESPV